MADRMSDISPGRSQTVDTTGAAYDQLRADIAKGADKATIVADMKADLDAYEGQSADWGEGAGFDNYMQHLLSAFGDHVPADLANEVTGLLAQAGQLDTNTSSQVFGSSQGKGTWADRGVNLYPSGTPSYADIHQSGIGDCSVVSGLAAWANVSPENVASHITQVGTADEPMYSVKMVDPTGKEIDILVDGKMLQDGSGTAITNGNPDGSANWVTIMEKALAKYDTLFGLGKLEGQGAEVALKAFTGLSESIAAPAGKATVEMLENYTKLGYAITGGFSSTQSLPPPQDSVKVYSSHGYTILGLSEDGTKVKMRNPWGLNDNTGGGIIEVPVDFFEKNCDCRFMMIPGVSADPSTVLPSDAATPFALPPGDGQVNSPNDGSASRNGTAIP